MASNAEEIARGLRHLRRADPVMRRLMRQAGPYTLKPRKDRFLMLVASIIAQQISGSAARSIQRRLFDHLAPEKLTAENLGRLTPEALRTVGLSGQKTTYLLDLANRVRTGELRLDKVGRLTDEGVIEELVKVKGIGLWTAQMFLMFSLGRLDVFPYGDLGVRMAIRNLYELEDLPDKTTSHQIAAPWRPYASIASWYCWRSLELESDSKN
jgi:DNA-3-methyladenine glycosylase II